MPIQTLAPEVAAQIAAGEVVERPASVVKELVENSLDAGASVVQVVVRGGGVEFIQVTDNGQGIPAQEVELAFQRHATSKLQAINDLARLRTLGFRGEALPSIAAVARVSLLTRTANEQGGTLVEVQEGAVHRRQHRAAPVGTTVTVSRLFAQVPARRKFLKSVAAETARIHEVLSNLALAYPKVRLTLTVEERTLLASPGTGNLRDVLAAVHGAEVARQLLPLAAGEGPAPLPIAGYISPPQLSRTTRSRITLVVNGRWVQSRALAFAVTEAYRGFLPERRHPLAALFLNLPPEELDVNVHPAKTEVRFRREGEVFSLVQRAVRETLLAEAPVPTVSTSAARPGHPAIPTRAPIPSPMTTELALGLIPPAQEPGDAASQEAQPFLTSLPLLRVLGQLQTTYIVAEGPDGMYLVDQHAAHERILYEGLQQEADSPLRERQGLLEPVALELTPEEQETLAEATPLLEAYGFLIEPFGHGGYLLRATPAALKDADPGLALREVLGALRQGNTPNSRAERIAISVACHSAVRAGQVLQLDEMQALVRQLERARQPQTCPHGRPTMMHLSASHLDRQFERR